MKLSPIAQALMQISRGFAIAADRQAGRGGLIGTCHGCDSELPKTSMMQSRFTIHWYCEKCFHKHEIWKEWTEVER